MFMVDQYFVLPQEVKKKKNHKTGNLTENIFIKA